VIVITSKEIGRHEVQVDASTIAVAAPREPLRQSVAAAGACIRATSVAVCHLAVTAQFRIRPVQRRGRNAGTTLRSEEK
jgi:hypothetical protein